MNIKEFTKKLMSGYLWGHLAAMAVTVVLLVVAAMFGLNLYTHHGQAIKVPDLSGMTFVNAAELLDDDGLEIVVADSGYNKKLPPSSILSQSPEPGAVVKVGHIIYVTVNSPSSPMVTIPDLIDNCSYREAEAKLKAIGFKLLPPKYITGEKDWVYGILSRGKHLAAGDQAPIDHPLTLLLGSGMYEDEETIGINELSSHSYNDSTATYDYDENAAGDDF